MPAEPQGADETGPGPVAGPASGCSGWLGRYGARWAPTATGPTPGPPPPCGMQKVLCRLRWDTSAPNLPGLARPDERVEVGSVDVDLAAGVVHQRADLGDRRLEDPVRRRVGDHDRGQRVAVPVDLGHQVGHVDVAVLVAGHDDDPHAGHDGAGSVGAVGRARDQADRTVLVAVGQVPAADGQQAGQLALGPGVGLQRDGGVAGHLDQPLLELADQGEVTLRLVDRRERVDRGELRPGDRLHLRGGVELHRAGAQRDHAAVQRVVAVGQRAQVAQHLGLGAVQVEDRVGQERRLPYEGLGQRSRRRPRTGAAPKASSTAAMWAVGGQLVAGDHDEVAVLAQVDAGDPSSLDDVSRPARHPRGDGVEEGVRDQLDAGGAKPGGQRAGVVMHRRGDPGQAVRAVVDGVHAGHHGEQHLGGADVAGRLLAADVLLAGLQGQPVREVAVGVDRHPDEAPGQRPREVLADGHEGGVRPAEAHRHAEPLARADRDVGAELAGRREQGQGQQVGGHRDDGAGLVSLADQAAPVDDLAVRGGVLQRAPRRSHPRAVRRSGRPRPPGCRVGAPGSVRRRWSAGGSPCRRRRRRRPCSCGGTAPSPRPQPCPRRAARRWRPAARSGRRRRSGS